MKKMAIAGLALGLLMSTLACAEFYDDYNKNAFLPSQNNTRPRHPHPRIKHRTNPTERYIEQRPPPEINEYHGPYLEGNVGVNMYYAGTISSEGSVTDKGVTGHGWSAGLGYFFTRYFAMEMGFMQNYAIYIHPSDHEIYNNTNTSYLTTRFSVPIDDRFSFLAKLGAMYTSVVAKHDRTANVSSPSVLLPYVGVGLGYALNRYLELTLQYQGAVYGLAGAGLLSGGLVVHF